MMNTRCGMSFLASCLAMAMAMIFLLGQHKLNAAGMSLTGTGGTIIGVILLVVAFIFLLEAARALVVVERGCPRRQSIRPRYRVRRRSAL